MFKDQKVKEEFRRYGLDECDIEHIRELIDHTVHDSSNRAVLHTPKQTFLCEVRNYIHSYSMYIEMDTNTCRLLQTKTLVLMCANGIFLLEIVITWEFQMNLIGGY